LPIAGQTIPFIAYPPRVALALRRRCERELDFAPVSVVLAELGDELRRGEGWQILSQAEEVLVACDQERAPADGQGEEIVVIRIGRADWGGAGWVLGDRSVVADPADEGGSFLGRDPFPELRVSERAREFGDEQF
jgi:hypothetical protein